MVLTPTQHKKARGLVKTGDLCPEHTPSSSLNPPLRGVIRNMNWLRRWLKVMISNFRQWYIGRKSFRVCLHDNNTARTTRRFVTRLSATNSVVFVKNENGNPKRKCQQFSRLSAATHHPIWDRSPLLLMSLVDGRCVLPEPIGWSCLQLDCPPSVAELFWLPPLKPGTLYRNTSSQLPRCSPSGVTWKRFTITIFLPVAL